MLVTKGIYTSAVCFVSASILLLILRKFHGIYWHSAVVRLRRCFLPVGSNLTSSRAMMCTPSQAAEELQHDGSPIHAAEHPRGCVETRDWRTRLDNRQPPCSMDFVRHSWHQNVGVGQHGLVWSDLGWVGINPSQANQQRPAGCVVVMRWLGFFLDFASNSPSRIAGWTAGRRDGCCLATTNLTSAMPVTGLQWPVESGDAPLAPGCSVYFPLWQGVLPPHGITILLWRRHGGHRPGIASLQRIADKHSLGDHILGGVPGGDYGPLTGD